MHEQGVRRIRSEVSDLIACFPGTGRWAWLHALAVPALIAVGDWLIFDEIIQVRWSGNGLSFALMVLAALPVLCMLYVAAFVFLGRCYRRKPANWPAVSVLLVSSWIYAIIVTAGFVLVAWIAAWSQGAGVSLGSILGVAGSLVFAFGELGLLLCILALAMRYATLLAPALAVAVFFYGKMLPVYYSSAMTDGSEVPWMSNFFEFTPMVAVTGTLRSGIVASEASPLPTLPQILLAILGYTAIGLFVRTATRDE